jgi:spermidine/putrescine-binding protein
MDSKHLELRHQAYMGQLEHQSERARANQEGINRRTFLAATGAIGAAAAAGPLLGGMSRAFAQDEFASRFAGITQSTPLNIIGTGVSVQDRFFDKFKDVSGFEVTGTASSLSESVQRFLTGGNETFAMIETNSFRAPALKEGEAAAPVPIEKITNWKYADKLFTDPSDVGADPKSGWPTKAVFWDDNRDSFLMVPQIYNTDALGILPEKFAAGQKDFAIPDTLGVLYEAKWRDLDFKGKSAIQNDDLIGPPRAATYLVKNGKMDAPKVSLSDLQPEEVDEVIEFLIGAKRDGVFRLIWTNYGEAVNLLVSGEVWAIDCWNPVVEDVKSQGVPCFYVDVWEGTSAWYYGMTMSNKAADPEVVMAYMDWCLEGWRGSVDATQGYYSPASETVKKYLTAEEWRHWYEGAGRDTGPRERRFANVAFWNIWPEHVTDYIRGWNRFIAA